MNNSPYKEFRADGWPFCPQCEEDELYSIVMLNWHGKGERPTLQQCLDSEMRCYRCGWSSLTARIKDLAKRVAQSIEEFISGNGQTVQPPVESSSLTLQSFSELMMRCQPDPSIPVGITCRPDTYSLVLARYKPRERQPDDYPINREFVYLVHWQVEPWTVFYDEVVLRAYLQSDVYPEAYEDALIRYGKKEPRAQRQTAWLKMIGAM